MDGLLVGCCSDDLDEILIFKISNDEAGFLIGKTGNRIKRWRRLFNCEINIIGNNERIVYISGKNRVRVYCNMICCLSVRV